MQHRWPLVARLSRAWRRSARTPAVTALACAALLGCKRSTNTGASPLPSASAAVSAPSSAPERCRAGAKGAFFSIGKAGARAPADADDQEAAQPFAIEVGDATAFQTGFAVSALQSTGDETRALVATLSSDAARGKVVDLGRVHGDVEPPRLAARDSDVFFALADHGPTNARLRVGVVPGGGGNAGRLTWGFQTAWSGRGASAFDLAVTSKRGLLVWDDVDVRAERQRVHVASFALDDLGAVTKDRTLDAGSSDQEMPEVVPRGVGYWLAWVASSPRERPGAARSPDKPTPVPAASADPSESVLEFGNRWIEIVALDENAAPIAAPRAVSPRDRHVLVFDLAATADGGALLAWRDDDSAPGAESRIVHVARVAASGGIERSVIDHDDVGAGAPSLITDAASTAPSWLALESVTHDTRVAALTPKGSLLDELGAEAAIGNGDALAMREGRLLLARPRGLAAELFVVACKPRSAKADAGAPAR